MGANASDSLSDAETGRVELPGYRLQRLIAASSRYEVFQAWSEDRSVPVALKLARPSAGDNAGEKLLDEGRMLAGLTHPNLLRLYEILPGSIPGLVLELLVGPSIADLFDITDALPYSDVVEMGRQVAAAVGYLHRQGWLHGDLKPGNVIADQGGKAVVIDLSLARPPGRYEPKFGTQGYLAPEQADCRPVSAATDVWGLGLLLLECIAGCDGFPPDCPEYRVDHGPIAAPPRPRFPRGVPADFVDLILKCTAFDPVERPPLSEVFLTLNELADAARSEKTQRRLGKLSSRPISRHR